MSIRPTESTPATQGFALRAGFIALSMRMTASHTSPAFAGSGAK